MYRDDRLAIAQVVRDRTQWRDAGGKIVRRRPICEKDRMDPRDPASRLALDPALLARFPEGTRHSACLQTIIGLTIRPDMPQRKGAAAQARHARGRAWLDGAASAFAAIKDRT